MKLFTVAAGRMWTCRSKDGGLKINEKESQNVENTGDEKILTVPPFCSQEPEPTRKMKPRMSH